MLGAKTPKGSRWPSGIGRTPKSGGKGRRCVGACLRSTSDSVRAPSGAGEERGGPKLSLDFVDTVGVSLEGVDLLHVPKFLVAAFHLMETVGAGYATEGLFRKPGAEARLKAAEAALDGGSPLPPDLQVADAAILVKRFFRSIQPPLFLDQGFQSQLIGCVKDVSVQAIQGRSILEFVSILPPKHRDALAFLALQLRRILRFPENKMDEDSLCTCVVGSIFRDADSSPAAFATAAALSGNEAAAAQQISAAKGRLECEKAVLRHLIAKAESIAPEPGTKGLLDGILPEDDPSSPLHLRVYGLRVEMGVEAEGMGLEVEMAVEAEVEPSTPLDAALIPTPLPLSDERRRLHAMKAAGLSKSGKKIVLLEHSRENLIRISPENLMVEGLRKAADVVSSGVASIGRRLVGRSGEHQPQPQPPILNIPIGLEPEASTDEDDDDDENEEKLPPGRLNFDEEVEEEEKKEQGKGEMKEEEEEEAATKPAPAKPRRRRSSLKRGNPNSLLNGLHAPIHELLRDSAAPHTPLSPLVDADSPVPAPTTIPGPLSQASLSLLNEVGEMAQENRRRGKRHSSLSQSPASSPTKILKLSVPASPEQSPPRATESLSSDEKLMSMEGLEEEAAEEDDCEVFEAEKFSEEAKELLKTPASAILPSSPLGVRPSIAFIKRERAGAVSSAVRNFNQRDREAIAAQTASTPLRRTRDESSSSFIAPAPYNLRSAKTPSYLRATAASRAKATPVAKAKGIHATRSPSLPLPLPKPKTQTTVRKTSAPSSPKPSSLSFSIRPCKETQV